MAGPRTLLLDRDGVINRDSAAFIRSPADWQPLPNSLEAIARAQHAGYRVIVISNQSGIARGLLGARELNAIHLKLQTELARFGGRIDAFFFCPHGPEAGCDCRKPGAGLLRAVARRLGIALDNVPFIGDRASDARAALAVGARPMLVRSGLEPPAMAGLPSHVGVYNDLADAVDTLV